MVGDKLNFNWQEVFNKFSDDLANAFDLFTGNLKLTKVFKATIIEKINDTVYKVSYKNAEYRVKSYYDLIVGDIVWVCAPGGDWDSLFVQSYNGFLDRIVTTDKVVNNLNTNVAGTVLDGRMGKSLKDQLDQQNSNLINVGSIYSGNVSGTPSTTDVVLSGSIQLPPGRYVVMLNIGTIEPQYFQQLSIRTGNNPSSSILSSASKKSSCVITVLDLESSTYVYPFAQMSQTTTISDDYRFNYLKAIRIK